MRKKKSFDAVAFMREARKRLEEQWSGKPRSEEVEHLRRRYARPPKQRKAES